MCAKNYDHVMYGSWDMVCNRQTGRQAERQIDGWKKWHIEVGAPIKKGKFKDLCASATRVVFYIQYKLYTYIIKTNWWSSNDPFGPSLANAYLAYLKGTVMQLCNNKYLIDSAQITNTKILAFITFLIFGLLSHSFVYKQKRQRNCYKVAYFFRNIKFHKYITAKLWIVGK